MTNDASVNRFGAGILFENSNFPIILCVSLSPFDYGDVSNNRQKKTFLSEAFYNDLECLSR